MYEPFSYRMLRVNNNSIQSIKTSRCVAFNYSKIKILSFAKKRAAGAWIDDTESYFLECLYTPVKLKVNKNCHRHVASGINSCYNFYPLTTIKLSLSLTARGRFLLRMIPVSTKWTINNVHDSISQIGKYKLIRTQFERINIPINDKMGFIYHNCFYFFLK